MRQTAPIAAGAWVITMSATTDTVGTSTMPMTLACVYYAMDSAPETDRVLLDTCLGKPCRAVGRWLPRIWRPVVTATEPAAQAAEPAQFQCFAMRPSVPSRMMGLRAFGCLPLSLPACVRLAYATGDGQSLHHRSIDGPWREPARTNDLAKIPWPVSASLH